MPVPPSCLPAHHTKLPRNILSLFLLENLSLRNILKIVTIFDWLQHNCQSFWINPQISWGSTSYVDSTLLRVMKLKMCVTSTALCSSRYFVDGKTFSVRKNLSWDLSWSLSAHRCNVASALSATMGGTIIHICFTERNGKLDRSPSLFYFVPQENSHNRADLAGETAWTYSITIQKTEYELLGFSNYDSKESKN